MIFFRQFKTPIKKTRTEECGEICEFKNIEELIIETGQYKDDNPHDACGNIVDLETGEVLVSRSHWMIPEWVHNATLRAIKVAQWREGKIK